MSSEGEWYNLVSAFGGLLLQANRSSRAMGGAMKDRDKRKWVQRDARWKKAGRLRLFFKCWRQRDLVDVHPLLQFGVTLN